MYNAEKHVILIIILKKDQFGVKLQPVVQIKSLLCYYFIIMIIRKFIKAKFV